MSGRKLLLAAALLAVAQIAFLSWMIAGRAAILRDGQEVLLKVEPIDPRDFLRRFYYVGSGDIDLSTLAGQTKTSADNLLDGLPDPDPPDGSALWHAASRIRGSIVQTGTNRIFASPQIVAEQ